MGRLVTNRRMSVDFPTARVRSDYRKELAVRRISKPSQVSAMAGDS